jgi:hypothetical protein
MVRPMFRKFGVAAVAALVLTTQACGRKPAAGVEAGTVQTLLVAAWSDDEAGFETVVDRPAVRADLRQQLLRVAQANMLAVEGGASDAALDRMITPHAFRLVDDRTGGPLTTAPSREQTAALLKAIGKNRVCLHDQSSQQACLLTFAKVKSGWRLVGMAPAGFTIAVGPGPEKTRS